MKIDLLHYTGPPVVGGVENVIGQHARLMTEAGHQVRILGGRGSTTDARIPFINIPMVDSRHPTILDIKAELDHGRIPESFNTVVRDIEQALLEATSNGDVLIAHNVCSLNKNLALTAALWMFSQRTTTPRLVLWHHDLAWTTPRYLPELYNGFPWDLLRTDWPKARQVVVSELRRTELAELTGLQPGQIHVVPNGLDFADFLKLNGQTIRLIKRLKLLDIHPLLILPVRITRRKNIELALRVLGHLCKGFPEAGLIVTGPLGPHNPANQQYRAELTALRSSLQLVDRAFFLSELIDDYLPYSVVVDFYRLADALLMPSREEGFGIPILESGLAGVPVFCTDIPALRELAGDQASYFLPDSDPEQIAAMIRNQLSASPVYHLRTRVRTQFSWEHIYTEHIEPWLC